MTDANVRLCGCCIGAVSWDADGGVGVFQHAALARSGIEPLPMTTPVCEASLAFPALGREPFKGLQGLLADARRIGKVHRLGLLSTKSRTD